MNTELYTGQLLSLADHAFSVACNSYGKTSLGLSTTIQFIEAVEPGDKLVARATEVKRNYRTRFYRIDIYHEQSLIATMDAVSYRKDHYFIDIKLTCSDILGYFYKSALFVHLQF
ncbi:hotdog domain-containing protein [Bacillus sp. SA1-12]|uniref:hotdog domain-containing protein n=1 Tax=Bacillus sp. SA1-12 TaxID=1455638 RepID=UPI000AA0AC90|nr:hotdog domain-containing protein [Bacillus sp. SA1-12]